MNVAMVKCFQLSMTWNHTMLKTMSVYAYMCMHRLQPGVQKNLWCLCNAMPSNITCFPVEAMVKDYVYKAIWGATGHEKPPCQCGNGNRINPFAVAVMKGEAVCSYWCTCSETACSFWHNVFKYCTKRELNFTCNDCHNESCSRVQRNPS